MALSMESDKKEIQSGYPGKFWLRVLDNLVDKYSQTAVKDWIVDGLTIQQYISILIREYKWNVDLMQTDARSNLFAEEKLDEMTYALTRAYEQKYGPITIPEGKFRLVIFNNGGRRWTLNDIPHRENDLPAMIDSDGRKEWFDHGRRSRPNGKPAVISRTGRQWWLNGECMHEIKSDGTIWHNKLYPNYKPILD